MTKEEELELAVNNKKLAIEQQKNSILREECSDNNYYSSSRYKADYEILDALIEDLKGLEKELQEEKGWVTVCL